MTWRETRARLRQDASRLRAYQSAKFGYAPLTWFVDPAWVCVFLHRLSHLAWSRGSGKLARLWMQLNSLLTGADIQPASDLGAGVLIPSPCGVTISCKAGQNLTALALAGLGGSVRDRDIGAGIGLPVVGNNVVASQFAGIQGSISVGDRVVVEAGAGAVVDIAAGIHRSLADEPRIGEPPSSPRRTSLRCDPCAHGEWRETWSAFRADVTRYAAEVAKYGGGTPKQISAALSNSLLALLVYRTSHWLWRNNHWRMASLLCRLNVLVHKLTIPPASCIGGGVLMPHLAGTIFSGHAGSGLTLYANSLCMAEGDAFSPTDSEAPVLGHNVTIAGHSGIFGRVAIGDRVQLGPKVQLDCDVAEDMQVWSGSMRSRDASPAVAPEYVDTPRRSLGLPAGGRWRETRRRLARDRASLAQEAGDRHIAFFPALTCVRLCRLSHYFHAAGRPRAARWCWLANIYLTGADIAPRCEIGGGLVIPHPAGIALDCRAGDDLTLMAITGIAGRPEADGRPPDLDEAPQLGDGVRLGHHSGIYGAVKIGDGVRILSGCIVARSVGGGVTLVPRRLKFRSPAASSRRATSSATADPTARTVEATPGRCGPPELGLGREKLPIHRHSAGVAT